MSLTGVPYIDGRGGNDTINLQAYATSYSKLVFSIVAPNTTINLANGKKIRLTNWTRNVTASQFKF